MGVYINGMEMPTNDDMAPTAVWVYPNGYAIVFKDNGKMQQYTQAVPVPPHGDLIDRNVLYHNMFIGPDEKAFPDRDVDNFPHEMRFEDIKRFIRKAQTVIQASE